MQINTSPAYKFGLASCPDGAENESVSPFGVAGYADSDLIGPPSWFTMGGGLEVNEERVDRSFENFGNLDNRG